MRLVVPTEDFAHAGASGARYRFRAGVAAYVDARDLPGIGRGRLG